MGEKRTGTPGGSGEKKGRQNGQWCAVSRLSRDPSQTRSEEGGRQPDNPARDTTLTLNSGFNPDRSPQQKKKEKKAGKAHGQKHQ